MQSPHRNLGPSRRTLLLGAGATAASLAAAGATAGNAAAPALPPCSGSR